jgi:carbonic anhydrase
MTEKLVQRRLAIPPSGRSGFFTRSTHRGYDHRTTGLTPYLKGLVMSRSHRTSRREFVGMTALAAGAAGLALPSAGRAASQPAAARDPDSVLARLLEGNKRFVSGQLTHPGRKPEDFAALAEGQAPLAIIIGCADSRVGPELIFDQGVGDLFVVRIAGNIVDGAGPTVKGSVEFAVAELGARLIMVLAHSQCGAVKAAIEHIDANDALPGSIGDLIAPIRPAVMAAKGLPGDKLENVTKANVQMGVERLKGLDPILSKLAKTGELKVVGATYELRTGLVKVFD